MGQFQVEGEKMAPTFPSNFENGAKYSLKLSLKILTFPSNFPSSLEGCPSFFCTSIKCVKLFASDEKSQSVLEMRERSEETLMCGKSVTT